MSNTLLIQLEDKGLCAKAVTIRGFRLGQLIFHPCYQDACEGDLAIFVRGQVKGGLALMISGKLLSLQGKAGASQCRCFRLIFLIDSKAGLLIRNGNSVLIRAGSQYSCDVRISSRCIPYNSCLAILIQCELQFSDADPVAIGRRLLCKGIFYACYQHAL